LYVTGACDRIARVTDEYRAKVRALLIEKALVVAAYGESVAAYRYRTLSTKTSSEFHRKLFVEIAQEEQIHHTQVREALRKHFSDTDFVLTAEDKQLVIVGPRMLDVTDRASFDRALDLICESERLTGRFYATLYEVTAHQEVRPLLKEMADECHRHAARLETIPPLN
jgi:rubrerythrin